MLFIGRLKRFFSVTQLQLYFRAVRTPYAQLGAPPLDLAEFAKVFVAKSPVRLLRQSFLPPKFPSVRYFVEKACSWEAHIL